MLGWLERWPLALSCAYLPACCNLRCCLLQPQSLPLLLPLPLLLRTPTILCMPPAHLSAPAGGHV